MGVRLGQPALPPVEREQAGYKRRARSMGESSALPRGLVLCQLRGGGHTGRRSRGLGLEHRLVLARGRFESVAMFRVD